MVCYSTLSGNGIRWIGVCIGFIALAASIFITDSLYAQTTPLQLGFTWTMPARFGLDNNDDGLIDYFTTAESISPASWSVTVDACAFASSGPTISTFLWSVAGQSDVETTNCSTTLEFPSEGSHDVTLTVVTDDNEESSVTQTVAFQDWLVVSLGDSFASGEGSPDVPGSPPFTAAQWQNADYHRSALAGPAVAARLLEEGSDQSSVTFVHLARSGTRIVHEDPTQTELELAAQIAEAQTLLGERQIDALLLSIGGNDVGFSRLIQSCIRQEPCNQDDFTVDDRGLAEILCQAVADAIGNNPLVIAACQSAAAGPESEIGEFTDNWTKSAGSIYTERSALLPDRYDQVAQALEALNIRDGGIYITEYARPTRQDSGDLCSGASGSNNIPGFSETEYQWADETALDETNRLMQEAAQRNGWTYIDGVADGFATHGYCANDNWITRIDQSVLAQLDPLGTLHPNQAGYAFTGQQIATQLQTDLATLDFALFVPLVQH